MENRFLLTWKPPEAQEFQYGMIQSYHIKINEKGGNLIFNKTTGTADPFFLIGSLSARCNYTFRVAAYSMTNKLGSISDEIESDIPLPQGE